MRFHTQTAGCSLTAQQPYNNVVRTAIQALAAVMGGQVDMNIAALSSALPFIQSGKVRALGIASRERSRLLPDVPTFNEAGVVGADATIWYGVLAPLGTPVASVEGLARDIGYVLTTPAMVDVLATSGADPSPSTPAAFAQDLRDEVARYRQIIKAANIRGD